MDLIQYGFSLIVPRPDLRYNQAPHPQLVGDMSRENSKLDRRSTRLSISIPITISGVDADGHAFSESVRTVIVNKQGGKIATTRHLAMGNEVLIENHAWALWRKRVSFG